MSSRPLQAPRGLLGSARVLHRFWSDERKRSVAVAPRHPKPALWGDTGIHAAWLGHSTVLLKIEGMTILTDPVFSRRIGLNFGPLTIGLKRLVEPALPLKETPRPDLILLSHAHMDHFDLPSLRALESRTTTVVTASKTSDLLRVRRCGGVNELGWGETARIGDVSVRAFEVNHWGARMRSDTFRGYNGYVIETPRYRVLFGGDTALTSTFRSVRSPRRLDLAIMPIGAYDPWIRAHCTPEQALQMADDAGAERILPVHHQTFQLSNEPAYEPIERLRASLAGAPERLVLQEIGEEIHLS
jgi:L-ascorbate metabolism protein UlaG (beta-lactamase superfamily)